MKIKILLIVALVVSVFSCKKETDKDPVIETTFAKSTAASTCYAKALVSEKGSYGILDHGFVFSNSNGSFGIENGNKISLGAGSFQADTFSTTFSYGNGYNSYQTNYVRAYLTNKKGTVYGSILGFESLQMSVSSIQPTSGKVGDRITISGLNFSTKLDDNIVKFNSTVAKVVEVTSTKLVVEVPVISFDYYYDSSVTIYVTVGGQTLNSASFSLLPNITGFSPSSGTFGTAITISGQNLNSYGLSIYFNGMNASVGSVSNSSITTYVPNNVNSGKLKIKINKNGVETLLPGEFTMNPSSIASVSPSKGLAGAAITITGENFNPGYGSDSVTIGGVNVPYVGYCTANSITVSVPSSLGEGTYNVEVNNGIMNKVLTNAYTVVVPKITSFSPSTGYFGTEVTLKGENLNSISNVMIDNYWLAISSRDSSTIKVIIPVDTVTTPVKIKAYDGNKYITCPGDFTILMPVITSFSPGSGTPGTVVTIKGQGFSTDYYNSTEVKFGTVSTNVVSVSHNEIKVQVPSNAGDGAMKLTVINSRISIVSATDFTILK